MTKQTEHQSSPAIAEYDFAAIETKWRAYWDERKLFTPRDDDPRPKYYALAMFPYPSGAGHMGHVRNYTLIDAVSRYYLARGHKVINPFGWDAFGLPAENAAIKTGVHPRVSTFKYIDRMRDQFKQLGFTFDWSREVFTCREDYYKWTQWLFTKMLAMKGKSGEPLVYRRSSRVNWCPKDKTVLANEQVVTCKREGKEYNGCFRCETPVEQKELEQWFFRITDYADELLAGLDELAPNWPDFVIAQQREWIGRSEGVNIVFKASIAGQPADITVYTTRADTLFGVTFIALAPEHPLMERIVAASPRGDEVAAFVKRVMNMDNVQREAGAVKEGIDTGIRARHPFTGKDVPVYVGNYVLMYGTGAVMAVPAHDQRDFEFAKTYGLPITAVIEPAPGANGDVKAAYAAFKAGERAFVEPGVMHDSGEFSGATSAEGVKRIGASLTSKALGGATVNFKIRDWGLSRQRYWGCPIPVIHCPACGIVPVPEKDLPVRLPDDVEFTPTGRSPLETHRDFERVDCPSCKRKDARRETDTMDTFVDSSWYYLRYCDPNNAKSIGERKKIDHWLPVDQYIGGREHAILHLIYARFICKVMRDLGLTSVGEPFTRLFAQGLILKESIRVKSENYRYISVEELDGGRKAGRFAEDDLIRRIEKMSKSQLNVVDPEYIAKRSGADTLRTYTLFIGPAGADCAWDDSAVSGCTKFLRRWWETQQAWLPKVAGAARPPLPGREGADARSAAGEGSSGVAKDMMNRSALSQSKNPHPNPLPSRERGQETHVAEGPCKGPAAALRRLSHLFVAKCEQEYSGGYAFNTVIAKAMETLNFVRDNEAALNTGPAERYAVREALETLALCMAPVTPHICEELWAQLGHRACVVETPWPKQRPELTVLDETELPVQVNGKVRATIRASTSATPKEIEAIALADAGVRAHTEGKTVKKVVVVPGRIVNVVVG